MNTFSVAILLVAVAAANASVLGWNGAPVDSAAVLSGPSGTVVRSGAAVAAPLGYSNLVAHSAPLALAHGYAGHVSPLALHSGLVSPLAYAVPAGHGLEGQWIPDINEQLYDDGSYKPHVYGY